MAWGVVDQAVSSLSNVVVLILVARSVEPTNFGAFSIAMEAYIVIVFAGRGMASDPLLTAHAADGPARLDRAARAGATVMLGVGVACAAVVGASGIFTGGPIGNHLAVLALFLPGLLIQDYVRNVFIVRQQPARALVIDALWLLVEVPLLVIAVRLGLDSVALLALWGVSGVVVGLIGLAWARLVPTGMHEARAWLGKHAGLWPYFLFENLVFRSTILVVMVGLSFMAGLDGVAGLRAATAVFAPVAVVGRGLAMVAVPEFARQASDPALVRRLVRRLAWFLTPLPLLLAAVLLASPDRVGTALFGESWALASPLLLLTAISAAVSMYSIAVAVGLRAFQAARAGLTARLAVASLTLVAALAGGWLGGRIRGSRSLGCDVARPGCRLVVAAAQGEPALGCSVHLGGRATTTVLQLPPYDRRSQRPPLAA